MAWHQWHSVGWHSRTNIQFVMLQRDFHPQQVTDLMRSFLTPQFSAAGWKQRRIGIVGAAIFSFFSHVSNIC